MKQNKNAPDRSEQKEESGEFSVFLPGKVNRNGKTVMATHPYKATTLEGVYRFVASERWAGNATRRLREISDHDENCKFKMLSFYVATFCCIVTYRKADCVTQTSGFMVLDFDKDEILEAHLASTIEESVKVLKKRLLADERLATVLMFDSPNGTGVKQVVKVGDKQGLTHREAFEALSVYILQRHGVRVDASGSDICRACYLPFDADCFFDADYKTRPACSVDLKVWLKEKRDAEQKERKRLSSQSSSSHTQSANDVYELVEKWVSQSVAYVKGSYNRYVSKCGYLLCEFGVPESQAVDWAINRFSDYKSSDLKSIFSSCYRHGTFGKRIFNNNSKQNIKL